MNIEQLKTVLELNRTRHFKKTADTLFVTQSTVSARLNALEQELGCKIFNRTSRSVELTRAGKRFLGHTQSILAVYRRALQEAASTDHSAPRLAVGGLFALWDVVLQNWLEQLQAEFPNLNLVAESHDHAYLLRQLLDGALDLIFIFEPPQFEELVVKKITQVPLIMVSNQPHESYQQAMKQDYIMVDWGEDYLLQHARVFAQQSPAIRRVNQARLALKFILSNGGAAYLVEPVVESLLDQKQLYQVKSAPMIERTVFAVYLRDSANMEFIIQSLDYF